MHYLNAQTVFDIRCEWGLEATRLVHHSDVVIIVDVLSFTTCVDIAVSRGAAVFPYPYKDARASAYAKDKDAQLASADRSASLSLSPTTMLSLEEGARIVLPSPNGATISLSTGKTPTFAACLRNANAVAHYVRQKYQRITIIPAGEKWQPSQQLRLSLEDWLGAGAIISQLEGTKSPEAHAAEQIFLHFQGQLANTIRTVASGIELIEQGFERDVFLACAFNTSQAVPELIDEAYVNVAT